MKPTANSLGTAAGEALDFGNGRLALPGLSVYIGDPLGCANPTVDISEKCEKCRSFD
jgi:hypothetical protein